MATSKKTCHRCNRALSAKRIRKKYCYPCERAVKKERTAATHDAYVVKTYGLKPGDYQRLYEAQGGKCGFCGRATGQRKRLAVDHDHKCCPTLPACGKCVRGLACQTCNKIGFGRIARDDPAVLDRGAAYLRHWPSMGVLYQED